VADTTTTHSEVVPSQFIEAAGDGMSRALNIADPTILNFADSDAAPTGAGHTIDIPWPDDHSTPAGTKAEGAEAPIVETSHSKATVSAGTVSWAYKIPLELAMEARIDKAAQNSALGTRKMLQRIDADGLAITTSLTNHLNEAGNDLTEARFLNLLFLFDAIEPDLGAGGAVFIAGSRQYANWSEDMRANSSEWMSNETEAKKIVEMFAPGRSFRGVRHGVAMVRSNALPTTGTNRHCSISAIGETSPYIYRNWWPIGFDIEWKAQSSAWIQTIRARFGWAKGRDAEGYQATFDNS
jgi:hypothetical protein